MGEIAALMAAFCWAIATVLYRRAGLSISPMLLNLYKGIIATVFLVVGLWCVGSWLPVSVEEPALVILILSGVIGIGIGDTAFFAALNGLGERRTLLIAETLAPPLALALAYAWLGESLSRVAMLGIIVTVAGVSWVIAERSRKPPTADNASKATKSTLPSTSSSSPLWRSGALAVIAALCQALGAVLSRQALVTTDVGPYWSSLIRLAGGMLVILVWLVVTRKPLWVKTRLSRGTWGLIFFATMLGTLIGIVLQQISLQYASTAIAQTLIATSVLFILPIAYFQGERVTVRAWLGAIVALVGVALLVL